MRGRKGSRLDVQGPAELGLAGPSPLDPLLSGHGAGEDGESCLFGLEAECKGQAWSWVSCCGSCLLG